MYRNPKTKSCPSEPTVEVRPRRVDAMKLALLASVTLEAIRALRGHQIALSFPMSFSSTFYQTITNAFSSSRWSFPILLLSSPRTPLSHISSRLFSSHLYILLFLLPSISVRASLPRCPLSHDNRQLFGNRVRPFEPLVNVNDSRALYEGSFRRTGLQAFRGHWSLLRKMEKFSS